MAKTVFSAFDGPQQANQILDLVSIGGFDTQHFRVIKSRAAKGGSLESFMRAVPSIPARLYQRYLHQGNSLLVGQVPENDVARLIKLLQSIGGHHIEAFEATRRAK